MLKLQVKGDYKRTEKWLKKMNDFRAINALKKCGEDGVIALQTYTPKDTGKTASSWHYEIEDDGRGRAQIVWKNSNVNKNVNIAVIIQYGHGTGTGGYVVGVDYINPALNPVFNKLVDNIREEIGSYV